MIERTVRLVNPKGLHARASHKLAECAQGFNCDTQLFFEGHQANAKQIMSVMLLAAPVGSALTLRCHGTDATACLDALCALIANGLGELGERAEH